MNFGIHQSRGIRDDLAVDCHPPVADVLLAVSARIYAGNGEKLLQAHAGCPRLRVLFTLCNNRGKLFVFGFLKLCPGLCLVRSLWP